jgi:hypothetical protein
VLDKGITKEQPDSETTQYSKAPNCADGETAKATADGGEFDEAHYIHSNRCTR